MSNQWWDGLQPQLDPEKITVGMMADLARRGTLDAVVRMIGLEVETPDADAIDTMANLTLVMAQQQRPGQDITFEDVLGMPFKVMVELLGLQEPPASPVPAEPSPASPAAPSTSTVTNPLRALSTV